MRCAWELFLGILPPELRQDVDRLGKDRLQELRLRLGRPIRLCCRDGVRTLSSEATLEQMEFIVNTASRYSPWAAASQAMGYITAPGGHRIGICGQGVIRDGKVTGVKQLSSLCLRVSRDFPGIGHAAAASTGNILILGPPGSGKTTLLRDVIRTIARQEQGDVAVVDERGEIFPPMAGFEIGQGIDVLTGCPKPVGVDMVLRAMGPSCIAVDEITSGADCEALEDAAWCGVRLLASAHARDKQDLYGRKTYQRLIAGGLFDTLLVLDRNKQWRTERMTP
jgi:stage III sporulation protein AA